MKLDMKLYKVTFGAMDKKRGDCPNWRSVNVAAVNIHDAIRKLKVHKNEYASEAEIVASIDVQ